MAAYIFLCSNATEDECLDRLLFGATPSYKSKTGPIHSGDTLYLYNYISGRFHGQFRATSADGISLVPGAWEGQFSWQVRVTRPHNYQPLHRADLQHLLTFRGGKPPAKLTADQAIKLQRLFTAAQRLPELESDLRLDKPGNLLTADGHRVRSMAEVTIDDFLYTNKLVHAYEIFVTVGKERMLCDFALPQINNQVVYIEYWGMTTPRYLARKERRKALYARGNLPLIELTPFDLENLADVLPRKLRAILEIKQVLPKSR